MKEIKSIDTEYAGHKFRSRLEARYAVLMNYLKIKWVYELEGYKLPSGWYLPDFYLPNLWHFELERGCEPVFGGYAEVKYEFNVKEIQLCRELCEATRKPVVLLSGSPSMKDLDCFIYPKYIKSPKSTFWWHYFDRIALNRIVNLDEGITKANMARFEFADRVI